MSNQPAPGRTGVVPLLVAGIGILLLVAELPFYLASGLMAPLWAVVCLLVFWVLLFVAGIRWLRRSPFLVLALPVVAIAVWFAAMYGGEYFLGWTA